MLITSADNMPLSNWAKISNNADLNYMFTDFEKTHEINETVLQAYYDLISEIPEVQTKSIVSYYLFLVELQKCQIKKIINEFKVFLKEEPEKINFDTLSRLWNDYLLSIEKKEGYYEIPEFYFEDVPEFFDKVKDVKFYHIAEYRLFIMDFDDMASYASDLFLKKHLKERKIKLTDIRKLSTYIINEFIAVDKFKYVFDVLKDLFHINTLHYVSEHTEKETFEMELAIIQKITDVRLTLKDNYLSEYIAAKKLAKIIETQNSKNK